MAKITYDDKVSLDTQPSVARENKVIDDDMNEIKSVVNTNADETIGTVLYNDNDGTDGTVTLSETSANYNYLEIFYYVITAGTRRLNKSVRVSSPNGKSVLLDTTDWVDSKLVFTTKVVQINDASITNIRNRKFTINESSTWTPFGTNGNVYIDKVLGYK